MKIGQLAPVIFGLVLAGCSPRAQQPSVVIYTAHDQIFSEKILQQFEQESGIQVKAVYDTEATKTVGLVNRIMAEKNHPQCDVFWNNEVVRTVMLKRRGLLQAYRSLFAQDIPDGMKDRDAFWAGFAARARILIYNTNLLSEAELPTSLLELTEAQWQGKVALGYPLFGTTATHAATLFSSWGSDRAKAYFVALKQNNILVVEGNADSKDRVVRGEVPLGLTDTDDASLARQKGDPVGILFPDQGPDQMGALVIPNTVALIHNCPHPEAGKKLIDFLLRRETEQALAASGSAQMPVRKGIPVPPEVPSLDSIKPMAVEWDRVESQIAEVSSFMSQLFVR